MSNFTLLSISFLLLSNLATFAQDQYKIDSLEGALSPRLSPKELVDTYNNLAKEYLRIDSTQVTKYINLSLNLAQKANYTEGICDAHYILGRSYTALGYFEKARRQFKLVLTLAEKAKYANGNASAYNGLGVIYTYQGNLEESLKYYLKSLKIWEELGFKKEVSGLLNNIGSIYLNQGNFTEALDYFQKSLKIREEIADKLGMGQSLTNIGIIQSQQGNEAQALENYFQALKIYEDLGNSPGLGESLSNIGIIYHEQKKHPQALEYLDKALKVAKEIEDSYLISIGFLNLGAEYMEQGKYNQAADYLKQSLAKAKETGDSIGIAYAFHTLGQLHTKQKKYFQAIEELQKSVQIAQNLGEAILLRDALESLSKTYQASNNYELAFESYQRYIQMKDSLQNEEMTKSLTRLESTYEFQKEKDSLKFIQEKERLAFEEESQRQMYKQRLSYIGLVLVSLLVVVISIFYWDKRKSNKKLSTANTQFAQVNEELKSTNHQLALSNEELQQTLEQLKKAQHQLIQSEKMASLGQLTAGIAHEINTPLGVINASIKIIQDAIQENILHLPILFDELNQEEQKAFLNIVNQSLQVSMNSSSKEERQYRKQLTQSLKEVSNPNAFELAQLLIDTNIYTYNTDIQILLNHPQFEKILKIAYHWVNLKRSGANIHIALQKASRTIFALKTYTHFSEKGKVTSINIAESIDTILTLYHSQIKKGIEVIKHYEDIPNILAVPDELNQVWTNLLQNAIQAMNGSGKLEIHLRSGQTQILIQFKDYGSGIPSEIQEKIFDPFFTTKPHGEGSGLGLAIVKKIISKHQGHIHLDTELGKGSTFNISLPIA